MNTTPSNVHVVRTGCTFRIVLVEFGYSIYCVFGIPDNQLMPRLHSVARSPLERSAQEDTMRLSSLSIVTQAYNEESIIRDVIDTLIRSGHAVTNDLEVVVVVCESSQDNTIEILRRMSEEDSRITIVYQSSTDVGYGKAFKMGVYAARKDYVFQTDADGQFDYSDLSRAASI